MVIRDDRAEPRMALPYFVREVSGSKRSKA